MVETLSWNDAIRLLLSHAAADGREEMLFGDSYSRLCNIIPDFIKGEVFPSVYLEFPLCGRPFLDASVGYNRRTGNISVDSEAVQERCLTGLRSFLKNIQISIVDMSWM